jgi:hypothetical protein
LNGANQTHRERIDWQNKKPHIAAKLWLAGPRILQLRTKGTGLPAFAPVLIVFLVGNALCAVEHRVDDAAVIFQLEPVNPVNLRLPGQCASAALTKNGIYDLFVVQFVGSLLRLVFGKHRIGAFV